jgi:hypothetical protein
MDENKQHDNHVRRQFKMQLDDSFLSDLEAASKRFARRSTQAAAEEILTLYFAHWRQAAEAALKVPKNTKRKNVEVKA